MTGMDQMGLGGGSTPLQMDKGEDTTSYLPSQRSKQIKTDTLVFEIDQAAKDILRKYL
jgi:hypothetical protein